jgi:hypothetical protein
MGSDRLGYFRGKVGSQLGLDLGELVLEDNFDVSPSLYRIQRSFRFVSSKSLPRISLSFACDSSNADGGNEVNAKYHAWNSSESVSISLTDVGWIRLPSRSSCPIYSKLKQRFLTARMKTYRCSLLTFAAALDQ